ncbi:MAG: glutamate synthase-related protein [Desulfurivibrionaceae bacterium]
MYNNSLPQCHNDITEHRDACAIIAFVNKKGHSTHANIVQTIDALRKMGHRSGDINGEGDGCGISTDIPRDVWAKRLAAAGLSPHLAESNSFFAGHFMLPSSNQQANNMMARIREIFQHNNIDLLVELKGETRNEELGPQARKAAPLFWQIGGIVPEKNRNKAEKLLFRIQMEIERKLPDTHIASLSLNTVVYKVQGMPDQLPRVFPELCDEDMQSVITLGHGRYSTNTLPRVERSQPFSLLGHNGEINTIERLRSSGRALGIEPVPGGSDSQDLNRIVEGLINLYNLDILEAMEITFPAIYSEVDKYSPELQEVYSLYRWFFPCSAQGPAAVLTRSGDVCMGSVDALGLRPLWFGESDYNFFLSSEKGVVDLEKNMRDPRPLGPGEKIAIYGGQGKPAEPLDYQQIQQRLIKFLKGKKTRKNLVSFYHGIPSSSSNSPEKEGKNSPAGGPSACDQPGAGEQAAKDKTFLNKGQTPVLSNPLTEIPGRFENRNCLAAFGWRNYDLSIRRQVALTGREVIGSMGYTDPLPALIPDSLPNIADYCKENVAVVTNPAIDREREAEHFSTRVVLGSRPNITGEKETSPLGLELDTPLLLGAEEISDRIGTGRSREICREFSTYLFEDVTNFFTCQHRDPSLVKFLDLTFNPSEGLEARLEELLEEALQAISGKAVLLILDDCRSFQEGRVFIDPVMAAAYFQEALIDRGVRRNTSLIVRSGAIRNLHDIMLLLGIGADALHPYLLWRTICNYADEEHDVVQVMNNTLSVLHKSMEKVMSTMGIHELCGYGRIFASIGLNNDLARIIGIPNFCPSEKSGLSISFLEKMAARRYARATSEEEVAIDKDAPRNPKVGKILRKVAVGKKGYREMAADLAVISEKTPGSIRHLLKAEKVPETEELTMDKVDISVGGHDMPLIIAAMSLGSQGESSFRTYAEAAARANIICINGEGGEIPEMLGKYRKNRGQQVASGRFGVFMGFLNSADYIEIKIGQGAKPGEGGHLPGNKVSEMVARARHCKVGSTLISPSNHHDIYSIEDLAQVITELKTANPHARVSVKIPVTTGIGPIAVGIVKAGADILNISGFEGGTGAAREHAKKFVGLPAEIGVSEAHRSLVESGLRDDMEIWADGGMRSGDDILKMILLGANRVGLGTLALMGVGCISCRKCHLDCCPRGISTQLQTKDQAEKAGVKGFQPRVMDEEAENLKRLLCAVGDELRMRVSELGETRLQNLVGKTELLNQYRMKDNLDCSSVLAKPAAPPQPSKSPRSEVVRKPLNYLTKLISDLAMERFEKGDQVVRFFEDGVRSTDRAIGTYLAGAMERKYGTADSDKKALLRLGASVPGNGLCAFITPSLETVVEGGSQDGAAKGSIGGVMGVFKGRNVLGQPIDGSAGKSLAYGAIGGLLMVQNMADSRACIRMSGADVVFGGRITSPIDDDQGNIACRSHLKGFAFEYMTGGRAVILGDPGPWLCAGMTGGVVYQCLYPDYGFDRKALERRLARGANVTIEEITEEGLADIRELLERYIAELERGFQTDEAAAVSDILQKSKERFLMIVPEHIRPPSAE